MRRPLSGLRLQPHEALRRFLFALEGDKLPSAFILQQGAQ